MNKLLTLLATVSIYSCASFNAPPPVVETKPTSYPVVFSTHVVMDLKNHSSTVWLETTDGFIQLNGGDVFTCVEKQSYTLCQVFGEPL